MREEQKKNNEKEDPTFYVDRDRAAAVVVGSKDIKKELKVRNMILIYIKSMNIFSFMLYGLNHELHLIYAKLQTKFF